MSYSLGSLPAYTDQISAELIHRSLLDSKTARLVRKMPGVKGPTAIPIMDTDVQFQAQSCGNGSLYVGSGSLTITQRTIVPAGIQTGQIFCLQDINGKFLEYQLKPGSYQESIPFEAEFSQFYSDAVQAEIEKIAWMGDTTSTTNNLAQVDGFIKNISGSLGLGLGTTGYASGSVHYSASVGSPITASNVVAIIDGIYQAIPAQIKTKPDLFIAVGQEVFDTYVLALRNLNLYNFGATQQDREIVVPGTNVKVYALNGLNNATNTKYSIVAGRWSNFVMSVDLDSDSTDFKFIYNPYADNVQVKVKFRPGFNVGIANEVVWAYNGQ